MLLLPTRGRNLRQNCFHSACILHERLDAHFSLSEGLQSAWSVLGTTAVDPQRFLIQDRKIRNAHRQNGPIFMRGLCLSSPFQEAKACITSFMHALTVTVEETGGKSSVGATATWTAFVLIKS